MTTELRPLTHDDLEAFAAHVIRQGSQSGRDGQPVFGPYPRDYDWTARVRDPEWLTSRAANAARATTDCGWERLHGAFVDGRLVGAVSLRGGDVASALHRATLGMGIEAAWQGRGLGGRLLDAAVAQGRKLGLAWIDLFVFAHNERAVALYVSRGFVEAGRVADQFRVDGLAVEDVRMVLRL